jgi:hypothetical protein
MQANFEEHKPLPWEKFLGVYLYFILYVKIQGTIKKCKAEFLFKLSTQFCKMKRVIHSVLVRTITHNYQHSCSSIFNSGKGPGSY